MAAIDLARLSTIEGLLQILSGADIRLKQVNRTGHARFRRATAEKKEPTESRSSVTGDRSSPPRYSSGKPPLSAKKRPCHDACHCLNTRCDLFSKNRVRKTIRARAIPLDEFSWRKYRQKPIKGSPFPRGSYKCSTVKGCPAKKHVERAKDDPAMLIVTYEWDHCHSSISSYKTPSCCSKCVHLKS